MDATNSSQSKFSFLRPYRQDDFDKVIRVFQTNVPQFFAPQEEQEFAIYLQEKREDYYIVEISEQVVGGGGINYFPQQHLARISWDFLHPDFQGKGYGKALTLYRIQKIQSDPQYDTVMVRTSAAFPQ
ncbi:MAG: GNAT family N-acetyltransferase, partial [Saprospiraceae bacterium]|nr:GNAT family N-acetyltransferase [Saprospiraceae bacterium]